MKKCYFQWIEKPECVQLFMREKKLRNKKAKVFDEKKCLPSEILNSFCTSICLCIIGTTFAKTFIYVLICARKKKQTKSKLIAHFLSKLDFQIDSYNLKSRLAGFSFSSFM